MAAPRPPLLTLVRARWRYRRALLADLGVLTTRALHARGLRARDAVRAVVVVVVWFGFAVSALSWIARGVL